MENGYASQASDRTRRTRVAGQRSMDTLFSQLVLLLVALCLLVAGDLTGET